MPIRRKVLLYLVFPVLLLGVVGILGVTSIGRLGKAADDILSNNYHTIRQAHGMEALVRQLERTMAATDTAAGQAIRSFEDRFEHLLSECRRSVTEPGEKRALRDIEALFGELRSRLQVPPGEGTGDDRSLSIHQLHRRLGELIAINERAMFTYESRISETAGILKTGMVVTLSVAAVVLVLFAVVAARRISGPIADVADHLHLALQDERQRGDGTAPAGNEIVRLRDALDRLLARLARYEDRLSRRILEAERQLTFVIDKIDHGLLLVGKDKEILAINRTARALLGGNESDASPSSLTDLRLPEDVAAALTPVLHDCRPPVSSPLICQTMRGVAVTFRVKILPFEGASPESGGYLVLFWDMTEERQFQEAREQFIATLSHQLKTPITSLSMAINLLWENRRNSGFDAVELLQMARTDCASVAAIVSELVDISRNLNVAIQLSPRPVDLSSLLRDTLRSLQAEARERGIELIPRVGETPLKVALDEVKFPWVVSNIVGNALRCTPRRGRITVEAEREASCVCIQISDTGRGLDANQIGRLFVPFVSLDPHPRSDAFGIGLVVAKRVVEGHGGAISVDSLPGRGTTFRIMLPLLPSDGQEDGQEIFDRRGHGVRFAVAKG